MVKGQEQRALQRCAEGVHRPGGRQLCCASAEAARMQRFKCHAQQCDVSVYHTMPSKPTATILSPACHAASTHRRQAERDEATEEAKRKLLRAWSRILPFGAQVVASAAAYTVGLTTTQVCITIQHSLAAASLPNTTPCEFAPSGYVGLRCNACPTARQYAAARGLHAQDLVCDACAGAHRRAARRWAGKRPRGPGKQAYSEDGCNPL